MSDPLHDQTRCTARRRNGAPCHNRPILGGMVCRMHGGSAPQVKRAAQVRLDMAAERAASVMVRIMEDESAATADQIRAAAHVLDRAGMRPGVELDVAVTGPAPWELLLASMLVPEGQADDYEDIEDAVLVDEPLEVVHERAREKGRQVFAELQAEPARRGAAPGPVEIERTRRAQEESEREKQPASKREAQQRRQQTRIHGSDTPPKYLR